MFERKGTGQIKIVQGCMETKKGGKTEKKLSKGINELKIQKQYTHNSGMSNCYTSIAENHFQIYILLH